FGNFTIVLRICKLKSITNLCTDTMSLYLLSFELWRCNHPHEQSFVNASYLQKFTVCIHDSTSIGDEFALITITPVTTSGYLISHPIAKINIPRVNANVEIKIPNFVGDSGSGKSTLLKLLLRLYKPSYGDVLIGGMNVNNISLRQWRQKCGAVMQDGKIFNDTILANITLSDESVDYTRLKHAVETANIALEIEQMPLGYQTVMGEMGRGLSGGQKQRVLIARALYKDPEFLFFDEATNALDTINEQKIVTALENVFKEKTVIVIAHRLSTIRKADQIVVMQNGMIVEVGTHEELLKMQRRYWQLVQSQVDLVTNIETSKANDVALTTLTS
ncbi:ATP-binding cassette domain-containing protein, partial [Mucilaginibacter sp. S1162]